MRIRKNKYIFIPKVTCLMQPSVASPASTSIHYHLKLLYKAYQHISNDNKMTAVRLNAWGFDHPRDISKLTNTSIPHLYKIWAQHSHSGTVVKTSVLAPGHPRLLTQKDTLYLLVLARYKPTRFLDKYIKLLERNWFLAVSTSTIHCTFERAGLSVKHVQKLAKERSKSKWAKYVYRIGRYSPVCLLFLDEAQPFVRKRRFSLVGGLALDEGIVCSRVLEGSYTWETFLESLWEDVVSPTFLV